MKRKPISVIGVIALVLAICSTMFCMTGCGTDVKVKINDVLDYDLIGEKI